MKPEMHQQVYKSTRRKEHEYDERLPVLKGLVIPVVPGQIATHFNQHSCYFGKVPSSDNFSVLII
jgi:hypothetical protein